MHKTAQAMRTNLLAKAAMTTFWCVFTEACALSAAADCARVNIAWSHSRARLQSSLAQ